MKQATPRKISRLQSLIVIAIIAAVGTFFIATIREGHVWGDDFGMYIHHAKNIVEGKAYADTGFIVNPYNLLISPQAYPPVFPLLLSPVYYWFGLNLQAMKVEIVLLFSVFLLIFWLTIKDELPFIQQAAIIAILGFIPYLWEFKDQIMSDISFLLFVYIALLLIQRARKAQLPPQKVSTWLYAIATGFIIYVAYGTRSLGGILLLSLLIYDLLTLKRLTLFTIIATVVATLMILLQAVLLPSINQVYFALFASPNNYYEMLVRFGESALRVFDNGHNPVIQLILFAIFSGFAIAGYVVRCRKNLTVYEIFMPIYIGACVFFPGYQVRYVLPIIPLFIWYTFIGVNSIGVNTKYLQPAKGIILATLVLGLMGSYAAKYTTENFGPIVTTGINKPETQELFAYIRANTEENAIFIFRKPRALSLYTDRRGLVFEPLESVDSTMRYFREVGANYLINSPMDPDYLLAFIRGREDMFSLVYSNTDFRVYKINFDKH